MEKNGGNKEMVNLQEKYPEAYAEVMRNPIGLLWDNMEEDRKIEVLEGLTNNMEMNKQ